jgi:hypothetical protein
MYSHAARKTLKRLLTTLVMVGAGACTLVEGCTGNLDVLINDQEAQDAFMWGFEKGYEIGETLVGLIG